ncbi:hypothetical protein GCM10009779_34960 [Polymorphospora rubra]
MFGWPFIWLPPLMGGFASARAALRATADGDCARRADQVQSGGEYQIGLGINVPRPTGREQKYRAAG